MRPRAQVRHSKTSPSGRHVWSLGARFGYWPCLKAPFIAFDLGKYRVDLWFGLPSYQEGTHG